MAVKIRYRPIGRKGQRIFWIIAIDSRYKRDSGCYLDQLGRYDPQSKEVKLVADKINYWLDRGAQATKSVRELLKKNLPVR